MRKAVISGHSRGLGYALAEHYLRAGWAVFGLARGRADLRPSENLFQAELDLSDAGLLAQKLSDGLLADFIRDADELLLINNAGTTAPNALLGRQGPSEIVHAVALNVTTPLLLSDYLLSARPDGVHLKSSISAAVPDAGSMPVGACTARARRRWTAMPCVRRRKGIRPFRLPASPRAWSIPKCRGKSATPIVGTFRCSRVSAR